VLDTNTVVRGLIYSTSHAAEILRACDRRTIIPLLSKPVLAEYREVLAYPQVTRNHPHITPDVVDVALRRLKYVSDYHSPVRVKFRLERDPDDEPFVELAITCSASHLITGDNDLLSLMHGHTDAAKRFRQRLPNTTILSASAFVSALGDKR
jgi:putative PIN family toxin of toxin-antitoxin system